MEAESIKNSQRKLHENLRNTFDSKKGKKYKHRNFDRIKQIR